MNLFPENSIKNWVRMLPLLAVVSTSTILTFIFIYQAKENHKDDLKEIKQTYINNAKLIAKDRIINIIKSIENIQQESSSKKISQHKIQNFIQNFRFQGNNYIFILDSNGIVITHIKQSFIGNSLWNRKKDGKFYVQDIIRTGLKKGGGYILYEGSINPKTRLPALKISYVTKIANLDWVIGTGVYLENIHMIFKEKELLLKNKLREYILNNIYITILITLICIYLIYLPSNNVSRILERYKTLLLRKNKILEERIKQRTKEQDTLLSLFDQADTVLFKWEHSSNQLLYVSKSIIRITGYLEQDFLSESIKYIDCIHKDDMKDYKKQYHVAIERNLQFYERKPYRIITKEAQIKWIHDYTLFVRNSIGEITNSVGYITDITLLIDHDRNVAHQTKMASLGEMIGHISHQWRQPLSTITTAASGLKMHKELDIMDDETFFHSIDGIMRNSQYLSETIDYFTNYIKKNQEHSLFELNTAIESNLQLIEANIKINNITIISNIHGDVKIYGNVHELIQVTMNIINNAIDILKNKENARLISLSTKISSDLVHISIKDNAGGIPTEIINKIFDPYFTTKHQSQGTGLGLYMSHNIINNMNGQLLVENVNYIHESKHYEGAQFTIVLPIGTQKDSEILY